ncbi:hypothetical protein Cfor_06111, partial [Coptotermes formosanus]
GIEIPPTNWIEIQLIGAQEGQKMTLECHSEAYPKSTNYWTRDQGEVITRDKPYFKESGENLLYLILGRIPVLVSMVWQMINAAGI